MDQNLGVRAPDVVGLEHGDVGAVPGDHFLPADVGNDIGAGILNLENTSSRLAQGFGDILVRSGNGPTGSEHGEFLPQQQMFAGAGGRFTVELVLTDKRLTTA